MVSETNKFDEIPDEVHELHAQVASPSGAPADNCQISRNEGSFWDLPKSWLQDIPTLLEETSLNVLVEYFAGVGQTSGSSIQYHCPNPDHLDEHPSFSVATSPDGRERAKCWSQCDWQGDALDFVEWQLGIETIDAIDWLQNWNQTASSNVPVAPTKEIRQQGHEAPVDNSSPAYGTIANQTMSDYLNWRNWPTNVVNEFTLSVVQEPNGDLRIRHPFLTPDRGGNWYASYWQDRSTRNSDLKWKSPKNGTSTLYNLQSLERENLHTVVICEGPADTISASVALRDYEGIAIIGVPGAQAWRPEYAQLLQGLKVVVVADNDAAGQTLESAICRSVNHAVVIARPADGDITDTANARGIESVRDFLVTAINGTHNYVKKRSIADI